MKLVTAKPEERVAAIVNAVETILKNYPPQSR